MNKTLNKNIEDEFDDEEIFDDSALLANFENSAFKETSFTNKNSLNISALCCDEEISGYDRLTGKTWIYPTNYPVRDYQFNIIKAAIYKNTLVSLPTGLGKTFIAAVIMYNFYRWYPMGKIVFTAPTRPLVAQQIEACYNIVAIPQRDTIEMTGHTPVSTRKQHWQSKRVVFATPQVIYNDIKAGICPGDKLRCLVIDEAHRARGNYAYCQIISWLTEMGHKTYRILALSATPGSRVEDVVNVIKNLNIAHLELRTENCIDVAPYSHTRKINTVIVPLGTELTHLRQQYVEILDGYARRLKQLNILPSNLGNLSKGRIVMLYKEFQTRERSARHPQHNIIMKDFTLLIALYHGLELLVKHGSRVFLNFFDEHPEKTWIQSDIRLTALLERLRDDLGINPLSLNRSVLPDGTVPEIPKNLTFGHPKFDKLKEIMVDHFQKAKDSGQDTKAIVFCEYRESVSLVHCLLLQCRPLIEPIMFVGQGASGKEGGATQRAQARALRQFGASVRAALVCTCVAEEGLDIAAVDLILCFDVATRSPVRLVQRCGRTGRKRSGQIYILVTEGREHQTLLDCMRQRDGLNSKILHSKEVENSLFKANPRLIPRDFTPECHKMHITVTPLESEKGKKGQKDIKSMLGRASSSGVNCNYTMSNELISEKDFNVMFPNGFNVVNRFERPSECWNKDKESILDLSTRESNTLKLNTWLEWQRMLQPTVNIGHSKDSEILTSLLRSSDNKRFDVPPTANNPSFNTQDFASQNIVKVVPSPAKPKQTKKKFKALLVKSPTKKDGDIRALFSTATKSTKNYTKLLNDLGLQNDGKIPTSVVNLMVDLNLETTNCKKKCYFCDNICDCNVMKRVSKKNKSPILILNGVLTLPDLNLIDDIDTDSILKCAKGTVESSPEIVGDINNISVIDHSKNFELDFDFDLSNSPVEEKEKEKEKEINCNKLESNFDIGDIEDIFDTSSPDEAKEPESVHEIKADDPKDTLGFFGLDSIDDIFADSDEEINTNDKNKEFGDKNKVDVIDIASDDDAIACDKNYIDLKKTQTDLDYDVKSPSILSGRMKSDYVPTSPILCTQNRKYQLSTKKNHIKSSTPAGSAKKKLILHRDESKKVHNIVQNTTADTSNNKSMFTITQLVEMINSNNDSVQNSDKLHSDVQNNDDNERCSSPILLTQAEKNKSFNNSKIKQAKQDTKRESLIILDSDSEDDDIQEYKLDTTSKDSSPVLTNGVTIFSNVSNTRYKNTDLLAETDYNVSNHNDHTPKTVKRKLDNDDNETISSPYFNKKQKTDTGSVKSLSLRDKVLAALSSNKFDMNDDRDSNVNFVNFSPNFVSQKENKDPVDVEEKFDLTDDNKKSNNRGLQFLQMYRRDSKITPRKINFMNTLKENATQGRAYDDSDDDFVGNDRSFRSQNINLNKNYKKMANHKVRKKSKPVNEFLDLEAEVSSEDGSDISEGSGTSLQDFLCDEETEPTDYAHYLQSVKSPVKAGRFKIPELPKKFKREEIFSQVVEEDAYEMDSFCVDSHIGLTQANDVSELELAEMILEENRKKRRKKPMSNVDLNNTESPIVRRKFKAKRLIDSDTDNSD